MTRVPPATSACSQRAQAVLSGERLGFVTKPSGPVSRRTTRLTSSPLRVPAGRASDLRADLRPGRGSAHRQLLSVPPRLRRSRTAVGRPVQRDGRSVGGVCPGGAAYSPRRASCSVRLLVVGV